jgi:hypothetical protein
MSGRPGTVMMTEAAFSYQRKASGTDMTKALTRKVASPMFLLCDAIV